MHADPARALATVGQAGAFVALATDGGAAAAALPTLCAPGEFSIADAAVKPFGALAASHPPPPRPRFVSLCADRAREPYGRVTYRFGQPGKVELEQTATASRKFRLWTRATSPHSGENIIGFSVGRVRYDVGIATVMGSGLVVRAFSGHRQLANLASGTTDGVDFRLGPASIDFDRPSSPVFELGYPTELDVPTKPRQAGGP